MTEPLAHNLVMAAQNASEDCGCGPNESAIVVAVLRELIKDLNHREMFQGDDEPWLDNMDLITLADQIEAYP